MCGSSFCIHSAADLFSEPHVHVPTMSKRLRELAREVEDLESDEEYWFGKYYDSKNDIKVTK